MSRQGREPWMDDFAFRETAEILWPTEYSVAMGGFERGWAEHRRTLQHRYEGFAMARDLKRRRAHIYNLLDRMGWT